jgi:hypothetical protein
VLVPALVRDAAGKVVYMLQADDYALTDDGVPLKLTLQQETGNEPLALVIAIEVGGAGARQFQKHERFIPAHGESPPNRQLPPGYRLSWAERLRRGCPEPVHPALGRPDTDRDQSVILVILFPDRFDTAGCGQIIPTIRA